MHRPAQLAALICSLALSLKAAEPSVDARSLPRVPPTEPENALRTFVVKKGFRVELVAAEPSVVDPIAMSFDEFGRLFVVEMRDYSERRDERLGRIRVLEDRDGDGRFETSQIFADNLAWPTAIICSSGGVFVGSTPHILFLRDNDGDGWSDQRDIVFSGFAAGADRLNVQALLNSFTWGLDNRIYGATSLSGAQVVSTRYPRAATLPLKGRDFSFDPRAMTIRAETGGGQHGMSFDAWGRRFACNNSDHIRLAMFDDRYRSRNRFYAMPSAMVSIAADGPAAEVFRISPEEPWRIIRTKWRVDGLVPGPIEGGGRSAGYFTGATGTTIYRGDAFPAEFLNNAFIGDAGGNLVHRKVLSPDGVGLLATRAADELKSEFLASRDTWFRPVQFANAPDGCLYIADMYREVIEHPWSLPPGLKRHLDLNSGNNRGRIYRIVPEGFARRAVPQLGNATSAELVALLDHPNGWHRDTAARLLFERQDKSVVRLLDQLSRNGSSLGRMHALYALSGLVALRETHILAALSDSDPNVREHGVRLAEFFLGFARVIDRLKVLTDDPAVLIRYQLAFTVGGLVGEQKVQPLLEIAAKDPTNQWIRAAVLSAMPDATLAMFTQATANAINTALVTDLARIIGAKNDENEMRKALEHSTGLPQPFSFQYATALAEGSPSGSVLFKKLLSRGPGVPLLNAAFKSSTNNSEALSTRVAAVGLLGWHAEAQHLLLTLLSPEHPQVLQTAALTGLDRQMASPTALALISSLPEMTSQSRDETIRVLLKRADRTKALLNAVKTRPAMKNFFSVSDKASLQKHSDTEIRQLATAVFGIRDTSSRGAIIEKFKPALRMTGDVARGRTLFLQRCASCHKGGSEGIALGPDMASVKNSGREKLLGNIIDPNAEVAPNFQAYTIETRDGEQVSGILVEDSAERVAIKQAGGKEFSTRRSEIASVRNAGTSLMPEGLDEGLSAQQMADLLEFIAAQ